MICDGWSFKQETFNVSVLKRTEVVSDSSRAERNGATRDQRRIPGEEGKRQNGSDRAVVTFLFLNCQTLLGLGHTWGDWTEPGGQKWTFTLTAE